MIFEFKITKGSATGKKLVVQSGEDWMNVRFWYLDKKKEEWHPSRQGVHLMGEDLVKFLKIMQGYTK